MRRDGATPYHTHPIQVSHMVHSEEEKIVALLHDTLEDTPLTYDEIKETFGEAIAIAVGFLTKTKHETYEAYIHKIKWNKLASTVKVADMFHNLTCSPSLRQKAKYLRAMEIIGGCT